MKFPPRIPAAAIFAPFAFIAAALWFILTPNAAAQPTPPASQSVTANTTTGALVSPSNFFTGNSAAILALLGNATISGNVTIPVGSTLTLNGAMTGTPSGGTLNLSGLSLELGAPTATSVKANSSAGLSLLNSSGASVMLVGPGPGTGVTFYGGITGASISLGSNTLTGTSAQLATAISDETGSGSLVFGTSPTITSANLVTPALGVPASGTLTNATGLPIVAGTTGTLTPARGGTGLTSPGASGNVLTSDGAGNWTSSAPAATGVTSVTGTANQITVTGTTTPTLSIPSVFIFPGNATVTGTNTLKFGATAGATIAVSADTNSGNLTLTSPSSGTVTLSSAVQVVASTGSFTTYFGGSNVIQSQNTGSNVFVVNTSGDLTVSGSLGYMVGNSAGGAVTQITSRTTGVTLNKGTGAVTLVSAAGSATWQTFTLTNSKIAAGDVVSWSQKSGTDKYMIHTTNVAAGSCQVSFATTGGTTTEQPVFNFVVIKGSAN